MRLLALFCVWFPTTILLFLFSIYSLLYGIPTIKAQATVHTVDTLDFFDDTSRKFYSSIPYPQKDIRVLVLKEFFRIYSSPLIDYVDTLVQVADAWGLDYSLMPAIAMQESGGCKTIPQGSFNCWGFGIYGDKVVNFVSFENAVAKVAKTLKEAYIKKGLTNATLLEDKWIPSSRGLWSYSVNFFIGKIREIEIKIAAT